MPLTASGDAGKARKLLTQEEVRELQASVADKMATVGKEKKRQAREGKDAPQPKPDPDFPRVNANKAAERQACRMILDSLATPGNGPKGPEDSKPASKKPAGRGKGRGRGRGVAKSSTSKEANVSKKTKAVRKEDEEKPKKKAKKVGNS